RARRPSGSVLRARRPGAPAGRPVAGQGCGKPTVARAAFDDAGTAGVVDDRTGHGDRTQEQSPTATRRRGGHVAARTRPVAATRPRLLARPLRGLPRRRRAPPDRVRSGDARRGNGAWTAAPR